MWKFALFSFGGSKYYESFLKHSVLSLRVFQRIEKALGFYECKIALLIYQNMEWVRTQTNFKLKNFSVNVPSGECRVWSVHNTKVMYK